MRRMIPVLLALCLLSGCASMLNRSYQSIAPHTEHAAVETDQSILQAKTYQGLVNTILYCVTQGQEHSVIRLVNYSGEDVEVDLAAACVEVSEDDPLGAYAVDSIAHSWKRIVSYYEVELDIAYRRTAEQVARIITATGSSAIRNELRSALQSFTPELVLRISSFSEDATYIETLLREAYYSTPAAALGFPRYEITVYPDSGAQRIVEIQMEYAGSVEALRKRSAVLSAAAIDLATRIPDGEQQTRVEAVRALLRDKAVFLPDAAEGSTGYAVLLSGKANSEGFALANELVLAAINIRALVVHGTLDGQPHVWNIVTTEQGERHLDITRDGFAYYSDDAFDELGYVWDTTRYPPCISTAEEEPGEAAGG